MAGLPLRRARQDVQNAQFGTAPPWHKGKRWSAN